MLIKTKVSFKEYAKLLLSLAYRKPVMIVLVCVGIINGLWILAYNLDFFNLPEPVISQYFTLLLISIVQPLGIFFMIWRNYCTSIHLRETLELNFTQEKITMKAKGFLLESYWSKMYKIIERDNWFVIYQNNLSAIIVPKKAFSPKEMESFKIILRNIAETNVSLKT